MVLICTDKTSRVCYVYKFFSDELSYKQEKYLNRQVGGDGTRAAKFLPVPKSEKNFILTTFRTKDSKLEGHVFKKCLKWKFYPVGDLMGLLKWLSQNAKTVDAQSTQWLWSHIVKNYNDLISIDDIKHDDMKFDNVILEKD